MIKYSEHGVTTKQYKSYYSITYLSNPYVASDHVALIIWQSFLSCEFANVILDNKKIQTIIYKRVHGKKGISCHYEL